MDDHVRSEESLLMDEFKVRRTGTDPLLAALGAEGLTLEVSSFSPRDGGSYPMVTLSKGGEIVAQQYSEDVRLSLVNALRQWFPKSIEKRYRVS